MVSSFTTAVKARLVSPQCSPTHLKSRRAYCEFEYEALASFKVDCGRYPKFAPNLSGRYKHLLLVITPTQDCFQQDRSLRNEQC